MNRKSLILAALLGLSLAGGSLAAANTVESGEASIYAMATLSATDAVSAVESTSGGKVVELILQDQNGTPVYQVTSVKSDGSELTYLVDGISGKVTATDDVQDNGADAQEGGESASDADSSNEDAD